MARHLADAGTRLAAGRDLLRTHIMLGPDGLARELSEWASVVTSLSVMRGLGNEMAVWSAQLAPFTVRLAGLAPHRISRGRIDQSFALSSREELANASQWLRAAGAALRPALNADAVRPADTELLRSISAAFPPRQLPMGPATESIVALCHGITVSASRLRVAAYRGRDRTSWAPDVASGGWQWMAQGAAITCHLSELALRSLAARTEKLTELPVTPVQLHRAADAMTGMREAWQRVDLVWNTVITEHRLLSTPAMSEASDLLLRMGRLVWDNPQWTPARAHGGRRRTPAALAPRVGVFTAVVSAVHQAADALARVAVTDITTVEAAARNGRLYVPTRSLPAGYDVPRAFAPALIGNVLEVRDAYLAAAEASVQAARELDEIAIALPAPSKALALARAAELVQTRQRGGRSVWPDEDGSSYAPRAGVSFDHSRASTGLPGPVERAVRQRRAYNPVFLLRAVAIDNAARHLIGQAENESASLKPGAQENTDGTRHVHHAAQLAAQSFPLDAVLSQSVNESNSRPGNTPSDQAHLRKR